MIQSPERPRSGTQSNHELSRPDSLSEHDPQVVDALITALGQLIRISRDRRDGSIGSGLSRLQLATLHLLQCRGHARLTEIAEALDAELSVLSRQVAALCEADMVDRMRDPDDGRAWDFTLTEAGRFLLLQIAQERREWLSGILVNFSTADLQVASEILGRVGDAWKPWQVSGAQPGQAVQPAPA